jgi:hypothetical protein
MRMDDAICPSLVERMEVQQRAAVVTAEPISRGVPQAALRTLAIVMELANGVEPSPTAAAIRLTEP